MLGDSKALSFLKNRKNLLAFSAGTDSTALFFILNQNGINFDIAIVNYNLRENSSLEVEYAKELAKKFDKKIFIKEVKISPPSVEKKARDIRYKFFEEIIKTKKYETLITAHQLNDQLEWFLMQFTKGAGLVELLGMDLISKKDNYFIVRPLLFTAKKDIKEYLRKNGIKYFIDETNEDLKYKRNFFRHNFSDKMIELFEEGIKKSFEYLHEDKKLLIQELHICNIKELFIIKNQQNSIKNIRAIDKIIKTLGYLLSSKQKKEIIKQKRCVVASKIAVSIEKEHIFISPYIKIKMDKDFKEECRVFKIPPNIRGYIYKNEIDLKKIKECIESL